MSPEIGFTAEVRAEWLAGIAGRTLFIGLFDGDTEIVDPRYERQPLEFGQPQSTADDLQFIENTNEAIFQDMGNDQEIDSWGAFNDDDELIAAGRLRESRMIPAQDRIFFEPGDFTLGLP